MTLAACVWYESSTKSGNKKIKSVRHIKSPIILCFAQVFSPED